MKKIIFSIILFITTLINVSGQEIGSVLLTMPENIILGLEAAQKNLLISNPDDTTELKIDRGTFSELKRLAISDDFISLQTSEAGTTQIKLLPLVNDSKIICVVKTVCNKICDSQIQFYTTKWLPIVQGDLLPKINKSIFIKTDIDQNNQEFENAYKYLDMNPIKVTLSPTDNSMKIEYDIKNYLSEEDYKKIQPYLIEDPITFTWDKTSYKR
ncbi:DUF3256 family protein [Dysgonomonas sp. Marseille-P4677]|uniref:DUF3256 family protein n=1 Tax=Dysgonomonas sp. Marseille-P4677 TaxID=2364790 RepID=UPI0019130C00|nr:DUF3256 family protein [Dysgonomonas sp. Marseille-P4677]MBK5720834.1 DUF3256 family protein [Dysgonomonas sp. Marseille-P4677]